MNIVDVLVQHPLFNLNRPFSYLSKQDIALGVRVLIELNGRELVAYVVGVHHSDKTKEELEIELGYELKFIKTIIDTEAILNSDLVELADQVASYYYAPKISVLHAMLPPSLKPSKAGLKGPKIAYEKYVKISHLPHDTTLLTNKQIDVYEMVKMQGEMRKSDLSQTIVNKLLAGGYLNEVLKEKSRLKLPRIIDEEAPKLTQEQTNAVNAIFYGQHPTYLLEGVTGSGKTEVYLKLAEMVLEQGKNVLLLVPEIALTPMMLHYFLKRFETKVALFHSELTPAQRYDEYRRISSGEVRVVVGARSAIFVPLSNIGLIVIDEEHSGTYKQESTPFYHAITVAEMRQKFYNSKIVLGSATPSLETRSRAQKGVYGHVFLKNRINQKTLPATQIIDMLNYANVSKKSVYFSNVLMEGIGEVLKKKEQAILLVNRRGYAGYITCRNCGFHAFCPDCGVSLTYHRSREHLLCHHCGYQKEMLKLCPDCGSTHLQVSGFGTERAVEQLEKVFPHARVLRLDSDVAQNRQHMTETLGKFANHEADILVGTQMIAKGHDFPLVTLVGVINADAGLAIPSYRAAETTFQLIMQAVGRSGRKDLAGRAIIQTTMPKHYAVIDASRQDYEKFYQAEMATRRLAKMPPYTFLMQISLSAKDEDKVEETILTLKEQLKINLGSDVEVIGPSIPLFQVIKNMHERKLMIKYTNYFRIKPKLHLVLSPFFENSQFRVKINIDPYDI